MDGLGGPFDLVILNSVIQYFPSVDYLVDVLRSAIALTEPSGAVFIGDVRSEPLLRAFHTAVELHQAPDGLTLEVLRARIQKQVEQESELAVAPAFFHGFAPDIAQVTVDLKRGSLLNEVVQFRYDVTLRRTDAVPPPERWLDWNDDALTIADVRALLAQERPQSIGITGIPNGRIEVPMRAIDLLESEPIETVGELRRAITQGMPSGVDPETLRELGADQGYYSSSGWLDSGLDGRFDTVFRRAGTFGFPVPSRDHGGENRLPATNPLATAFTHNLVAELRAYLQERLPDHMIPAVFVLIDRLPQTPSGKVDRGALPMPDSVRDSRAGAYVAPRGRSERLLAAIWADILNVERVGVHDDFFELGGHSLLVTQLVSRIRVEFQNEISVRTIFEAPTIAGLAARLERERGNGASTSGPGITRVPRGVSELQRLPPAPR
jgi:acyl carrier protein